MSTLNLKDLFRNEVSSSAFKIIDGEKRIIGKYGQISIVDNLFDIWIIGPDLTPLNNHRITAILKKMPVNTPVQRLTGECYVQTPDIELVREILPLLGIKKRRKYSPATIQAKREQLARMRVTT